MSIVVGVDFSETAARAADVAALLAQRLRTPLWILHGMEPGHDRAEATARLEAEASRLRRTGAEVSVELVSGLADEKIAAFAGEKGAELLVVGALGRRTGSYWRLGSTAERLAQLTTVPILIVRDGRPFEAWAKGERPLTVLLATDFNPSTEQALEWVGRLRRLAPVDVVLTHLFWPPDERARLGLPGPAHVMDDNEDVEAALTRELMAQAQKLPGAGAVRVRTGISLGRPADHLISWAAQEHADLIVVGRHPRSALGRLWHGSVSQGLLHHAPLSVACVPLSQEAPVRAPTVQRILIPAAVSSLTTVAVAHAAALAPRGSTLLLLHVLEEMPVTTLPQNPPAERPEVVAKKAEIRARLGAFIPPGLEERGLHVEIVFADSLDVPKAILQGADRLSADLICVASHGRTGLAKAVLGSVAEAVVTQSPRPVLVVKAHPA